jgi:predicted nucleic acid-binding Zn ribbon protein
MGNSMTQLKQLRQWRTRQDKDLSIGATIHELRRTLKKSNKQLTQLIEAWDELVPSHIHECATPISFQGGVLEVFADGSPTAYQLNRMIRAGLLRELQQRCSGTLKQVRVRVTT